MLFHSLTFDEFFQMQSNILCGIRKCSKGDKKGRSIKNKMLKHLIINKALGPY